MKNPTDFFHRLSYLQYPLMAIGLFYALHPYFTEFKTIWEDLNYLLIFAGLSISFSTLQDTTKTQNNFSKKIWEDPKKGKRFLIIMSLMALSFILIGIYGLYISDNEIFRNLSFGTIVLGIGLVGMLKSAIEMFENHRKDKQTGSAL